MLWIGPLERRALEVFWEAPEVERSARDVADRLDEYAYTTVATVLDRLVGKELLVRRSEARVNHYSATGTRAVHTATLMREVLNATRDPESALAAFVAGLDDDGAQALREALGSSA